MIYIYDIDVNFNDEYYNFYEWEKKDIIEHIRKINIIRVNMNVIDEVLNKNIIVNKTFLNNIYNKCELFGKEGIENISYACILTDTYRIIGVIFDNEGRAIELSSLCIGEEIELLNISDTLETKNIKYEVLGKETKRSFFTRRESKIVNNIIYELEKIKDDKEKVDYLCFEWFENQKGTYQRLINDLLKVYSKKHEKFFELLKEVV